MNLPDEILPMPSSEPNSNAEGFETDDPGTMQESALIEEYALPGDEAAKVLELLSQLMPETLIQQSTQLMREQAQAYRRLTSACEQLTASLVRGAPETITSLVRAGETELLQMRARLVRIMSALTTYADKRSQAGTLQISAEARTEFGQASNDLLQAARDFQSIRARAAALAVNGSNFTNNCIEMCGVQPTTYRAPYA